MIDMEAFSKSMEFNHTGIQLLLVDYLNQYKCPMTDIDRLCEAEDYFELMTFANKLKLTLELFDDQVTPIRLAQLEHLAKHEFYPPDDLIQNIKLDLNVVQQQILQLTQLG